MITGENKMDSKHNTEVLIDGKIYTLAGSEEEGYIQRLASYINEMVLTLKRQEGFTKQSAEYQNVMIELNMADDYFKAREQIVRLEQQKAEMEKETYSLKHELVANQMKLEAVKVELAEAKKSADLGKKE
jgi:cell division protein ZapA